MEADIVLPRLTDSLPPSSRSLQYKMDIHIPDPYHYTDRLYTILWHSDSETIIIYTQLEFYALDCSGTTFTQQTVTPFIIMKMFNIHQLTILSSRSEGPIDNIHNLLDAPISTMSKCTLVLRSRI